MRGLEVLSNWFAQAGSLLITPDFQGVIRMTLALVFVWSGLEKLRQPVLAGLAMAEFGVVRNGGRIAGLALGLLELTIATSLVLGLLVVPALCLSFTLFFAFTILITISLARGKSFSCFCFGNTSERLSRLTLLRSMVLLALSAFAFEGAIATNVNHPTDSRINMLYLIAGAACIGCAVVLTQFIMLQKRERSFWITQRRGAH